jgi:hypothetical protein
MITFECKRRSSQKKKMITDKGKDQAQVRWRLGFFMPTAIAWRLG